METSYENLLVLDIHVLFYFLRFFNLSFLNLKI